MKIGILAKRGKEQCLKEWNDTARYLSNEIPNYNFKIIPLGFEEIEPAVKKKKIDFILTNSSFYVELEVLNKINRIATLKNRIKNKSFTQYSAVIFTLKERGDIKKYSDLIGKHFMAVQEKSFGGWLMALRELNEYKIFPKKDFKSLSFCGTHDAVVYAVKQKKVDAGTIRTDTLERMHLEGKIDINNFYILHQHGEDNLHLPFPHSTRQYPEWPMAKLSHTNTHLAEKVSIALIAMPMDSKASLAGKYSGWTIPLNYQKVRECLKILKVSPYKDIDKIKLKDVLKTYFHFAIITLTIFFIMIFSIIVFFRMNQKIRLNALILQKEVNDRKEAEKQLQAILETSMVGIMLIENRNITKINKRMSEIIGYEPEELLDKNTSQIHISYSSYKDFGKKYYSQLAKKEVIQIEYPIKRKDGSVIYCQISGKSLNREKPFNGVVCIFEDITEKKIKGEKIKQAKIDAETAAIKKSKFLANMSHEIRTPMNAILGMAYLCLGTILTFEQRDYIEKIHKSANLLIGILNDILDLSKIEAGQLKFEETPFYIEETLNNLSNMVSIAANEKGIDLFFDLDSKIPNSIIGDPLRFGQILLNLTNNAVKFTKAGEIIVSIYDAQIDNDDVFLSISVEDTGIGMTKNQIKNLFKPFTQGDTSTTRKYGGTGLGLAITRQLIEKMGGSISLESRPDIGTKFLFNIKFKKDKKAHTIFQTHAAKELENIKILVIDPSNSSKTILSKALRSFSFTVSTCDSYEKGVQLLKSSNKKDPFKFIFLDSIFKETDNNNLFKEIKSLNKINQPTLILMVKGNTNQEILDTAKEFGIRFFLKKPIIPSQLLNTILSSLKKNYQINNSNNDHQKWEVKKLDLMKDLKALIVEDNIINQIVASQLLEKAGLKTTISSNGKEAVEILKEHDFQIILMDINMPVMDGITATKIIRKNIKIKNVPIIAMTANTMAGDREKFINHGMNDHISKPIDPKIFFRILKKWLPHQNSKLKFDKINNKNYNQKLNSIIDFQKGINNSGGRETLYHELLDIFLTQHENDDSIILKAFNEKKYKDAEMKVHTIKGVSGGIGAIKLFESSKYLEEALSQERSYAVPELLDVFIKDFKDLINAVKNRKIEPKNHKQNYTNKTSNQVNIIDQLIKMLKEMNPDSQEKSKLLVNILKKNANIDIDAINSLIKKTSEFEFEQALKIAEHIKNQLD